MCQSIHIFSTIVHQTVIYYSIIFYTHNNNAHEEREEHLKVILKLPVKAKPLFTDTFSHVTTMTTRRSRKTEAAFCFTTNIQTFPD